mmetsp:Transcript_21333/g.60065  ORF Transcript_21333/g.60065 Transcript_21333/m.60065 type:complete len:106 (-) Transcript_21333:448-765(-)
MKSVVMFILETDLRSGLSSIMNETSVQFSQTISCKNGLFFCHNLWLDGIVIRRILHRIQTLKRDKQEFWVSGEMVQKWRHRVWKRNIHKVIIVLYYKDGIVKGLS